MNCIRTVASSELISPLPLQSAFLFAAVSSCTEPATALFSRTQSVTSTRPSRLTSPYRTTPAGTVSVVPLLLPSVVLVVSVATGTVVSVATGTVVFVVVIGSSESNVMSFAFA